MSTRIQWKNSTVDARNIIFVANIIYSYAEYSFTIFTALIRKGEHSNAVRPSREAR